MEGDGLFFATALFGAMNMRPNNAGTRKDGAICTAQGGECRYNSRFYTPGMRDAKSWTVPIADDSCPVKCWALRPLENKEETVNSQPTPQGSTLETSAVA
jgi:hypothetical protein